MKRYTRKVIGGEYEGSLYNFQKIVNKLGEYEDAEEQGLFVKLPCRVGDVLYTNISMEGRYARLENSPYAVEVVYVAADRNEKFFDVSYLELGHSNVQFNFDDIGRAVFRTREEAERALREERSSER